MAKVTEQDTTSRGKPVPPGRKILIVDDADLAHNIYRVLFGSLNVTVLSAKTGNEALAMLSQEQDIGLIILDMNMASMNGLELLRVLPDRFRGKIPIVMASSEQDEAKQQMALSLGATEFCEKSKIKVLRQYVEQLFRD